MDPINQKERTTSFLQFMLLFLVTIIFVNVGVFFNTKFFKKDYDVLKAESKKLERLDDLRSKIDTLNSRIPKMDKMTETEWKREKDDLDDILEQMISLDSDSSNLQLLTLSLKTTFKNSIFDKDYIMRYRDSNSEIKEMQNELDKEKERYKELEKDYKDMEKEYNLLLRGKQ
jgi:uncharacterized protein YlxW (UPF0749 family)